MFNEQHKKESPILGLVGLGGGIARAGGSALGPFVATGGTKTGPEGGYYYHEYTPATPSPQKVFTVTDGISDIEIAIQGAGGAGGGGSYPYGGGGGGGGATGIWTITGVTINTHPITTGADLPHPNGTGEGDAGGYSQISHPSDGYVRAGGGGGGQPANGPGAGGAGGTNSDPWSAATITGDYTGANGGNSGAPNGSAGGNSGGYPQPVSNPQPNALWWRLRITNPAYDHDDPSEYPDIAQYGGYRGNPGPPEGGSGGRGNYYGGGGGGGGNQVGAGGGVHGGMVVIRYPDAV